MKGLSVKSRFMLLVLFCIGVVSYVSAATGFMQTETSPETWLSVVKWLGAGAIGILSIIAITRLIQVLINRQPKSESESLIIIQRLNLAITLIETTMRTDHERMLKHDDDFFKRIEALTLIQNQTLSNDNKIIGNQENIIKQLDKMERKMEKEEG